MTKDSSRLIGDIIEINSDIVNKRINSTSSKLVTNIKEKYYRYRLKKVIKKFNKLILDKFNLQELFSYILTYYEGKYKCIQKISVTNYNNEIQTLADILVNIDNNDNISHIRYNVNIDNKPNMNIVCNICYINGTVETITVRKINLLYTDIENSVSDFALKVLNDSLIDVLTTYINEYLERFNTKGYIKEVKE